MNKLIAKWMVGISFTFVVAMVPHLVRAQFGTGGIFPGTDSSNPVATAGGPNAPVVPFDGGMSLLLAVSGIGYCAKKFRKNGTAAV